ncbi:hypothetical protein SAMN02745687_00500 [Lachnospiraceae bacterium NK3A20]|nr:hypothetical protein SAMN02745687_00500 [Lachnospiraceae bacterium NK3A20]
MTRVQIFTTRDGLCRSFTCKGHTDYTTEGADIVCAGVSAIVISTINSLEDLLHEDIEVDYDKVNGGDITVNVNRDLSEKGQFLIDHMIYGLEWIQRQYGRKYLSYEIKEV